MTGKKPAWTWDDYRRDFPGAAVLPAKRARRARKGEIGAAGAASIEGGSTKRETATVREPPPGAACDTAGAGLTGKPGAQAPEAGPAAPMPAAAVPPIDHLAARAQPRPRAEAESA